MQMLLFFIGKERYAIDCENIVEVLPKVQLKKIPQAPPFVAGILNLGGLPIPVIDMCWLIEKRYSEECMHTRIVLLSYKDKENSRYNLGILGEKVTETRDLDPNQFFDPGVKIKELSYVDGVMDDAQGMIRFINIDMLFQEMKGMLFEPDNGLMFTP